MPPAGVPVSWWAPPIAERRKLEAMACAVGLGHQKMTSWIALPTEKHPERWMARCWGCDMFAIVYADGRATGPATVLWCWQRRGR